MTLAIWTVTFDATHPTTGHVAQGNEMHIVASDRADAVLQVLDMPTSVTHGFRYAVASARIDYSDPLNSDLPRPTAGRAPSMEAPFHAPRR